MMTLYHLVLICSLFEVSVFIKSSSCRHGLFENFSISIDKTTAYLKEIWLYLIYFGCIYTFD